MAAKLFASFPRSAAEAAAKAKACFIAKDGSGEVDSQAVLLFGVSVFCIVMPMELGQMTFALIGALVYAVVQAMRKSAKTRFQRKARPSAKSAKLDAELRAVKSVSRAAPRERNRPELNKVRDRQEYRQQSAQPVTAPTFQGSAFDAQVQELLTRIVPSAQSDICMKALAAAAKTALGDLLPDAEVAAFASADVTRGTAFGVAVPEVNIVLNAKPDVIAERLRVRTARPVPRAQELDARSLQKSALRACTDELVASGVFKFRRSAFKGTEPKVTLLSTVVGTPSIPVDFSVNTVAPLYNEALLTECGQIDPRARELILLVRRWAKDRGVSHAAKGHLSPYAWTLLAIYFMQVRADQDGPRLTKLKAFKISSQERAEGDAVAEAEQHDGSKTVAALFQDFFHFYAQVFDWRNEGICVRSAKRAAPSQKLQLHIVLRADGTPEVAPSIVDPFEPSNNLGGMMTATSISRLRGELTRADGLLSQEASLTELLEPWVPPEHAALPGQVAGETNVEE